jgi:hypothetical protein
MYSIATIAILCELRLRVLHSLGMDASLTASNMPQVSIVMALTPIAHTLGPMRKQSNEIDVPTKHLATVATSIDGGPYYKAVASVSVYAE